tara:strand:- start:32439 stop:32879 length:441 start_codon:yes stop_codon:yes gene_type:complete
MKRKFKLISNPVGEWIENDETPMKIGRIIAENEILTGEPFSYWYRNQENDWEELFDEPEVKVSFDLKVESVMSGIKEMLIQKNKKYGDSALNPIRVFSNASSIEQIKVRLDDKLSRLKTQHIEEDEDVLDDLIGYLILLKIAINDN